MQNLLNPCNCQTTGICKCCQPRRETKGSPSSSHESRPSPHDSRPSPHDSTGHTVTESLIEMFKSKATTITAPAEPSSSRYPSTPPLATPETSRPTWAQLMVPREPYLSPDNMHHPAHTSPHVHKTKLYSPYTTSGHLTPKHGLRREDNAPFSPAGWASMSTPLRPPPPKIRPLADMYTFLGAVFNEDGTIADQIPRAALGLPGIHTFDAVAEDGGVKIEPMEVDETGSLAFPTAEDVVIGACTCGEDCDCPGCATHVNAGRTGENGHASHESACGDNCKSNFDCSDHLSLPSGITSIEHLLSLAAANVPPPARPRANIEINAHDTRIMPPAVHVSKEAARTIGVVQLKPLECCNGRCQCMPGQCTCEKECCGCCVRCACDEDGDTRMEHGGGAPNVQKLSSCCAPSSTELSRPTVAGQSISSPAVISINGPLLSPESAMIPPSSSGKTSPHASGTSTPSSTSAPGLRGTASTSRNQLHHNGNGASVTRRASVNSGATAAQRSASTGKAASKALALHTAPHHPHPRPILPKPASHGSNPNGSHLPPAHHIIRIDGPSPSQPGPVASSSDQSSRIPSPGLLSALDGNFFVPNMPVTSTQEPIAVNLDPSIPPDLLAEWTELTKDADLMAYLDQLNATGGTAPDQTAIPYATSSSSGTSTVDPTFTPPNFPYAQPAESSNGFSDQPQEYPDLLAQSMPNAEPSFGTNAQAGPSSFLAADALTSLSNDQSFSMYDGNSGPGPFNLFYGMEQGRVGPPVKHSAYPNKVDNTDNTLSLHPNDAFFLGVHPDVFTYIRNQKANGTGAVEENSDKQNPNLIDLSRPLQSGDVERILKALQIQQENQPPPTADHLTSEHDASNADDLFDNFVFDPALSGDGEGDPPAAEDHPASVDFDGVNLTYLSDSGAALSLDQLSAWASAMRSQTGV